MMQEIKNIQNMMRELIFKTIEKYNMRILDSNAYNCGVARSYCAVLNMLYNQAKIWHIPLKYLGLNIIDPEKASFSNEIFHIDNDLHFPEIKEKYQEFILNWLSDNKLAIRELYEDFLPESEKDEFYAAMIDGFKEIFELFKKYNIKILD